MMISSRHYSLDVVDYTINYFQKKYSKTCVYLSITIDVTDNNFSSYYTHHGDFIVFAEDDIDILAYYDLLKDVALEELSYQMFGTQRKYYPVNQGVFSTSSL